MSYPDLSESEFDDLITRAMDELPQQYIQGLKNVVIVVAEEPTVDQRRDLKLHCNETLFGLYKGIPLTKRGGGYNMVLPDKITLFKQPLVRSSETPEELFRQVKHTLWHEIAHYYGLDHDRIHELEQEGNKHAAEW